ncbi:MAG: TraX family protein [Lachnospiraceae bacterium]|nr:TraX family protein [Lachnospiraceae bacterium]
MNISIPDKMKIFSGSALKTIAILSMTIDHFAAVVLYWGILYYNQPVYEGTSLYTVYIVYRIMRSIGRIAFPIYCFLLVEGFMHTGSRPKYLLRLGIFALISEIPFDLAIKNQLITWEYCNVFFTLCLGFLAMWALEYFKNKIYISLPIAAVICYAAYFINCDYDYHGILLIVILYLFRYYRIPQVIGGALSLYWEWPAIFAFIPILMYNGKRGRSSKYFFYLFYPTHLLLFYFLSTILS